MNEDDFWQRVQRRAATIAPMVLGLDEAEAKAIVEGSGCQFSESPVAMDMTRP